MTEAGRTPVVVSFEAPPGLVCMGQGADDGQRSFMLPGRLAADSAASDAPLEQVDLDATFRVSAESAIDGSGITELVWQRWMPDVVAIAESREAFASSTGLVLDAAEHHRLFWWTLTAEQHRSAPSEPWLVSGEVVVFGADGFRDVSIGTGAFEGQTAPSPTTFQTLVGDELLRATVEP